MRDIAKQLTSALLGALLATAAYGVTVRQEMREVRRDVMELRDAICWQQETAGRLPPFCRRRSDVAGVRVESPAVGTTATD